ncbi:MAG: hypothetical protein JST17_11005 [Bacteroidetes bacterium]|nr:hypothetical protein [Bacteroidota bacterium]
MISGIIKPTKIVMKATSLLTLLLSITIWVNGQDKDIEAQMHYTSAEDKYSKGGIQNYEDCFEELGKAESILGKTNSKILYLKIKALSSIAKLNETYYSYDTYYYYDIDTCLKTFFNITDAKSYPVEKYTEILNIKDLFQKRGKYFKEDAFVKFKTLEYKNSDTALLRHARFLIKYTMEKFLINKNQALDESNYEYDYRPAGFADSATLYPEFTKAQTILHRLSHNGYLDAMETLVDYDWMLDYNEWENNKYKHYLPFYGRCPHLEKDEEYLKKLIAADKWWYMYGLCEIYGSLANQDDLDKKQRKEFRNMANLWEKQYNEAEKKNKKK